MNSITINAYSKINLYLDVKGKRADGYHEMETVMHTISLCDIVTVSMNDSRDIAITCTDLSVPCNEKNIAYKCAKAFFDKTGILNTGISISITKNIPSQAGMGGGSTDGAAVLCALNRLFDAGLSENELCSISAPIGADIPFCIIGGCGYCTGIGEIIASLPRISGCVLIAKGTEGISTAEAFGKIDSIGAPLNMSNVYEHFKVSSSFESIAPYCKNLFDEVTGLNEIDIIKKTMLRNNAVCSCMTGSGSAVFGLYNDTQQAAEACSILKNMGFFSAVCHFI